MFKSFALILLKSFSKGEEYLPMFLGRTSSVNLCSEYLDAALA